ncbi:MAG: hypothetical protein HOC71_19130 [Candidatus Latescibacteria bacterium]|jgi:hypothetical protein|nr:hypothetical protein [Candidatus Latescibacterota bacterium]
MSKEKLKENNLKKNNSFQISGFGLVCGPLSVVLGYISFFAASQKNAFIGTSTEYVF